MKIKNISIIAVILFLANLLLKGLFVNTIPNSPAPDEIALLGNLHLYLHAGNLMPRLLMVVFSSCIPTLLFIAMYRQTKNVLLSICIAVPFSVSPWLLVFSRFVNIYVFFIMVLAATLLIESGFLFLLMVFLLVIFQLFFSGAINRMAFIHPEGFLNDIIGILDLKTLFFSGDYLSPFLRIPRTGFFMMIDIIPFLFGLSFIITGKIPFKNKLITITTMAFLFYFLCQPLIPTYKSVYVFFILSTVIGFGYYRLVSFVKSRPLFLVLFATIFMFNFIYYQELFYNHFDKKNSTEWGYAKMKVYSYLASNPGKTFYFSKNNQDLERYLQYYVHTGSVRYRILTDEELKQSCKIDTGVCILKEDELDMVHVGKDMVKTVFRHDNGLPQYFLL